MAQLRQQKVSLWKIFLVFAKIGAFTIGGGYAMVMLIRDEVVGRGWISAEEFPDLLALSQSAPGLLAVNMSIFAGYRIRGVRGGVVATLGSILPPFLIILIIAMVFAQFKDNPVIIRIFKGIRPVVVALIAVPMVKMARDSNKKWWSWIVSAVSLCLVAFLKISPIYILLVTIVVALSVSIGMDRKTRMRNMRERVEERRARDAGKSDSADADMFKENSEPVEKEGEK